MNTLRIYAVLMLALAGAPPAAQAQTPEQRIEAARRSAATSGIPVQLLESKVAEGRAKGVPMDRIAAAVEHRLSALNRAREVMAGTAVTPADLSVGADALDAGVEAEALRQVTAAAPADRRAMAIAVLTELVSNGESSARALARVSAALRGGPEALRRLPGEAASENSRRGTPPGRDPSRAEGGQGRGRGGPPASVPGATHRPDNGGGRGGNGGNGGGKKP
ncbi:MAG TPA: hypothetical protein VF665_15955 [Longimicrobium sp.]|jgi:hypothetical protein|uniref:hypothetical protein n=1 Tax=Longimicrobium sp. TaxID=2029185 RepID=UPI002ED9F06A